MSRILYLDAVGGIAGDMTLAALIDAGARESVIREAIAAVGLDPDRLSVVEGDTFSLRGLRVQVDDTPEPRAGERWVGEASGHDHDHDHDHDHHHDHDHDHHDHSRRHGEGHGHTPWRAIRERLQTAALSEAVRSRALRTFERIAIAEAAAHGVEVEAVGFHEVGAVDSIIDIVGVAAALTDLAPDRVVCSPLPMGRGVGRSGHGPIPLPPPAVVAICEAGGIPVYGIAEPGETVTPTGAAIAALADAFGPIPSMRWTASGQGIGTKPMRTRPNALRVLLGEEVSADEPASAEAELLLSANIDDMAPTVGGYLLERLFQAGALDAWFTPILMKKSRPAFQVSVLVPASARARVSEVLFRESTTIGLRAVAVDRTKLRRETVSVETPWGSVAVKVSHYGQSAVTATPEYEDCRRIATENGVPLRVVQQEATAAWGRRASTGEPSGGQ